MAGSKALVLLLAVGAAAATMATALQGASAGRRLLQASTGSQAV